MYVASNLVRSQEGGEGVNAYLHLHRTQDLPRRASGAPDVDAVTTLKGGYLVARSLDLAPGGNEVRAHLDVVADDEATEAALDAAIDALRARIGPVTRQVDVLEGGVAARFGAVVAFDGHPTELREIFDRLWSASRALLARREEEPLRPSGPLVVWAEPAADGVHLCLPPATLARLPRSARRRARVTSPSGLGPGEVAGVLHELALMLLDVSEAEVAAEGGIEIVEPRSASILVSYPPAVKL